MIDNNNFIRMNVVKNNHDKINVLKSTQITKYIDLTSNDVWVGKVFKTNILTTRDNGKTWDTEEKTVLFGAYFFLSTEVVNHQRNVYNIVNLLSSIGGFMSGVFMTVNFVVLYVNK